MNVATLLDYTSSKCPSKIAYSDEKRSLTFAEVQAFVHKIGTALSKRLGCVNMPIVVLSDRNVESICAFLGVAASRNFYVPLDVNLPEERIRAVVEQVKPAAIIVTDNEDHELYDDVPLLNIHDLMNCVPDEQLLRELSDATLPTDPLYAICTSGSTGVPKVVVKPHQSVTEFIPVFAETFGFSENDVFGNQAPFDFDVSAKDIYTTLYCGASMYIIPKSCFVLPKKLVDVLEERGVTALVWSVSALCVVAGMGALKHHVPSRINKILFSGEVMPLKMLNIWRSYYPDVMFVNLYGPTESTGNCMYYIVPTGKMADGTDSIDERNAKAENQGPAIDQNTGISDADHKSEIILDGHNRLPLGNVFPHQKVLFLNEADRPIQTGEIGEIVIGGPCLALGYYRDPERTAAVFVRNPLNDQHPERVYRTGDLAELAEDGQYYFVARKDHQIKHMGHRIELEEIEAHMNGTPGVVRACCLFDRDRNKIVACYSGDVDKLQIIQELKMHLPKYMIPNIFVKMDSLPLSHNGKIDRQELLRLYKANAV